jgi:biotin operon repressor
VHELGFVGRYFGVGRATVHGVIKRFVQRGYQIESHRKNAGRPMHYRTNELEALI